MLKKVSISVLFILTVILCHSTYAQYLGGNSNGFASEGICTSDLNGSAASLAISIISGSSVFCDNSAETFQVTVTNGTADNFLWTGPSGMTVNSQQVEGYANLLFGTTAGTVTVEASNVCATATQNIVVSNAACTFYQGGNNDGISSEASCNTTLDGVGTGLSISAITGSSIFCDNSAETFQVTVTAGVADNFLWSGPSGFSVLSQQIDGFVNMLFTNSSGNISVEASNNCAVVSQSLAISNGACGLYKGGIGDGSGLPITLISFEVFTQGSDIEILWSTASEKNNEYFVIERSIDANNWQELLIVEGAGNSTEIINYNALDKNPLTGISYYRLKQVDFDGTFSYSGIETANTSNYFRMLAYPMPAREEVTITVESLITQISVHNIQGQAILVPIEKSVGAYKLDISHLNPGIYSIRMSNGINIQSRKLIVQK